MTEGGGGDDDLLRFLLESFRGENTLCLPLEASFSFSCPLLVLSEKDLPLFCTLLYDNSSFIFFLLL